MARGDSILSRLPTAGKIGVGAGLLGMVAVAYFVVFYGDLASSIQAAQGKEQALRQELAQAHKAEFAYQKDLEDFSLRQQRQREFAKILPSSTEYPAFLSAVQTVANVSGVALSAWTPNAEVAEQFYARVPMKLELRGRYHQIAKFFYGVGQLDRIINMENIAITDPQPEGEDIVIRAEALATAFRTLEEAKIEPADKRGAAQGAAK